MGFQHRCYQLLGGSLTAALMFTASSAWAEDLRDWSFDSTNSELTFSLPDTLFPEFFLLSEPPRLVLDIPATDLGNVESQNVYNGVVQTIRVAQHSEDQVRAVIELVPDIVLAPAQADIQFDDGENGQRHWRFRPLLAGGANTVITATTPVETPSSGLSLSADNLKLPQKPEIASALPLDPYTPNASTNVVSVPPLEDSAASSSVVSVPPLAGDVSVSPATSVTELPPMTVPDLEEPTLDQLELPTVAAAPEAHRSSLPDINGAAEAEPLDVVTAPEVTASVTETPPADAPQPAIVETALVPDPITEPSVSESALPQAIQQPAANRTIVQTAAPAPLTFGQPLPESSK
ncbi:MAG: AMIN domain-containing protein [Cyanobacteria bacterium P01_C01_bin.118]